MRNSSHVSWHLGQNGKTNGLGVIQVLARVTGDNFVAIHSEEMEIKSKPVLLTSWLL